MINGLIFYIAFIFSYSILFFLIFSCSLVWHIMKHFQFIIGFLIMSRARSFGPTLPLRRVPLLRYLPQLIGYRGYYIAQL